MILNFEDVSTGKARHFEADRYVVGVDLGQSIDPTAVCIIKPQSRRQVVDAWYQIPEGAERPADMIRPPNEWFANGVLTRARLPARIDVLYLERLPLRMAYPDQIAHVAALLARPPLSAVRTDLVVDQTGVGRPIVDYFRRAGLNPRAVTITAGDGESNEGAGDYRVSKLRLVSRLQALLHSGELRIAPGLKEAKTLAQELGDFQGIFTATGYARFGAREGAHDDLVLATAIACWWAFDRTSREAVVGTYTI